MSNIDALSRDEARRLSPQEVDPVDEEAQVCLPATPKTSLKAKPPKKPRDPLVDTTPFGSEPATPSVTNAEDATLFGALWPLGATVKLDATVDRRVLRQHRDRLSALGYAFEPLSQDWHMKPA